MAKRIWYKRAEHPVLDALPSAAATDLKPMRAPKKRRSSVFRRVFFAASLLSVVVAIVALSLMTYLREDRLTGLARDQIARLAGKGYETDLAKASLNFFSNGVAGIEIDNISIRNALTQQPLIQRGKASFAVSLVSLFFGKLELTQLSLLDAEMHFEIGSDNSSTFIESLKGTDGLLDPALAAKLLNNAANTISGRLNANPDLVINAQNTQLIFGKGVKATTILIETLTASKTDLNEFAFNAVISNQNWATGLTGAVGIGASNVSMTPYRMTLNPIPFSRGFEPQLPDFKPRSCSGLAGFAVASSNGQTNVDVNLVKTNCTFGALGDYAIDVTVNGNLKRDSGVFEIGRGAVNVNRSVFNFDGAIAPARYTPDPEKTGETPRYRYELVFAPSVIDSLDNVDGPLALEGKIAGTYAPAESRLALDEFTADAGGSILRGAASLLFTDVTPALYLALTSDKLPVKDFKRIWPRFAAPTPRGIVQQRVLGGTIRNLRLELQLPPGKIGSRTPLDRTQLSGSGDVENASFVTIGQLPPVQNASGRVVFDGKTVDIELAKGNASLPSGRKVDLAPSNFRIADTHAKPTQAELNVDLSGSIDAVAEIASQQPINALANQEFSPDDFLGKASAKAKLMLTLVPRGETAPTPKYQVSVALSEFTIKKAIRGQKITNASGAIKANNQSVDIVLAAELSGIPAKISISEPQGAPERRKQDITLTLSDTLRNQVVPGLKPFLSGPVSASISSIGQATNIELDLTKAVLRIVPLNWEKGAGIGTKASFAIRQNGTAISVSNLKVTGKGLEASGQLQIKDGTLQSAELTNVRLNPGDNFSIKLSNSGKALSAIFSGAQLDARALLKQMLPGRQPRKSASSQIFSVDGKIKRLIGFNEEAVLNAVIGFTPGESSALSLTGDFENGGSIDLSRTSGINGRLIVQTGNAGAALRFIDLYKRMVGGTLATNFKVSAAGALTGPISISDFTVIGEPRLAQLVSEQAAGSKSLAEATQTDLTGKEAKFELAQGNVVLDRGTIRLNKGIVRGANVGATAEGIVLSATGQMDLRGTFMPARGLNRIVGSIPILGLFLGSGSKAGLIGITYQLAGDAKNPKVFVNPISMIAPGVFRQIFE